MREKLAHITLLFAANGAMRLRRSLPPTKPLAVV
jgi:hypothetical protein